MFSFLFCRSALNVRKPVASRPILHVDEFKLKHYQCRHFEQTVCVIRFYLERMGYDTITIIWICLFSSVQYRMVFGHEVGGENNVIISDISILCL